MLFDPSILLNDPRIADPRWLLFFGLIMAAAVFMTTGTKSVLKKSRPGGATDDEIDDWSPYLCVFWGILVALVIAFIYLLPVAQSLVVGGLAGFAGTGFHNAGYHAYKALTGRSNEKAPNLMAAREIDPRVRQA